MDVLELKTGVVGVGFPEFESLLRLFLDFPGEMIKRLMKPA